MAMMNELYVIMLAKMLATKKLSVGKLTSNKCRS